MACTLPFNYFFINLVFRVGHHNKNKVWNTTSGKRDKAQKLKTRPMQLPNTIVNIYGMITKPWSAQTEFQAVQAQTPIKQKKCVHCSFPKNIHTVHIYSFTCLLPLGFTIHPSCCHRYTFIQDLIAGTIISLAKLYRSRSAASLASPITWE